MENICFKQSKEKYGDILHGNICKGKKCQNYKTCIARIEFDNLPKYTLTDYEICEAIRREKS